MVPLFQLPIRIPTTWGGIKFPRIFYPPPPQRNLSKVGVVPFQLSIRIPTTWGGGGDKIS